jgi:sugar lactone lactonase YvrE
LYVGNDSVVAAYAPGATRHPHVIARCIIGACALGVDRVGRLYVSDRRRETMFRFAKNGRGVVRERTITQGIDDPVAVAFDRSGRVFIANCVSCFNMQAGRRDTVAIYQPGASSPWRRIFNGIVRPVALIVDSAGTLYVASSPFTSKGFQPGWISVYAPRGTRPLRTITDGIDQPVALAVDASNHLYVANESGNSVAVYAAGGTKMLHVITEGIESPTSLVLGTVHGAR